MYIVTLYNGNAALEIHNQSEKLYSGQIVKGINAIDSFTFSLLPSNIGFNAIYDFLSLVSVYNTRKNKYEFWGRVLCTSSTMSESGLIQKEVTCESYFGFLCDSQQSYVNTQNWTVRGLLEHIINQHNEQLEEYKRFEIGEITVTDNNDNLYLGIQRNNTWNTIKEKLLDTLGGEIRFRVVDGVTYIDYLEEIGETRTTEIALSRNMKSITKDLDPSACITRLIPLGYKYTNDSEERLDISSVNGGKNYIDDVDAIEAYGLHVGCVEFDDVKTAGNLLRKGQEWLVANNKIPVKYSITALDLSLLGLDIDDFDVCNYHPVKNALLDIDDVSRIIKKTIDVCEEVRSTIEVGENFKSLSDIQREQFDKIAAAGTTIQKIQAETEELRESVSSTNEIVDELNETVINYETTVLQDCERIIFEALEDYVETGNFESYKETVSTQLRLMSDEFSAQVIRTQESIAEVNGDLQTKYNTITKYFTFNIDGLTIGQAESPYKVVIDNDRYSMLVDGVEVLWIANGEVHTPEITVTQKFNLFGYLISQDEVGKVNCDYIGGES